MVAWGFGAYEYVVISTAVSTAASSSSVSFSLSKSEIAKRANRQISSFQGEFKHMGVYQNTPPFNKRILGVKSTLFKSNSGSTEKEYRGLQGPT